MRVERTDLSRLLAIVASVALVAGVLTACRQGMPVIDTSPRPPQTDGTISGTVRGPEGTSAVAGRTVQVINVATGERQSASTNSAGGFTFKVKPGRYRVELTLMAGESLLRRPSVIDVNRSDVDAHADFVVGAAKANRRWPRLRGDDGLGAPSA